MASQQIGSVKSGRTRKLYHVFWDPSDKTVYVDYAGKTNVGKASSTSEAMNKVEAWLFDK
jgi:hypothetical protein